MQRCFISFYENISLPKRDIEEILLTDDILELSKKYRVSEKTAFFFNKIKKEKNLKTKQDYEKNMFLTLDKHYKKKIKNIEIKIFLYKHLGHEIAITPIVDWIKRKRKEYNISDEAALMGCYFIICE